mgnify:CR=1 FL=1
MLAHIERPPEGNFICGECGESFDENKKCITHLYSHQNLNLNKDPVPTFPCDECNYIFLKISILKNHKIDMHKMNNLDKTLIESDDYDNLSHLLLCCMKL